MFGKKGPIFENFNTQLFSSKSLFEYNVLHWMDQSQSMNCGSAIISSYPGPNDLLTFEIQSEKNMEIIPNSRYADLGVYKNEVKLEINSKTIRPVKLTQNLSSSRFNADISAYYHADKVEISAISSLSGVQNAKVSISNQTIDNFQLLTALRGLDFSRIEEKKIFVMVVGQGLKLEVLVKNVGLEIVKVPFNTFECYRLLIDITFPVEQKQYLLIAKDNPNYLVKYIRDNQTYELASVKN